MTTQNAKNRELSLGDDFGPAVLQVNGLTLSTDGNGNATLNAPGNVTIITKGNITAHGRNITAHTDGNVQLKPPAPEQTNAIGASVTKDAYNIGDVLPDGWVVGPVSPETGHVMAIEPASGALDGYKTWYTGEDHARELRSQGHETARQPSESELNALYNDVVKAGRNDNAQFNTRGSFPYGNYWSSTPLPGYPGNARIQCFDDGDRYWSYKGSARARVRCIWDEPGLTLA